MSDERKPDGLSINTIVMGAILGLFGFFASDFVKGRDNATIGVENVVREVLDLRLAPLIADVRDLKSEIRENNSQNRTQFDDLKRRLSLVENTVAVDAARFGSMEERVDRIGLILRERSTFGTTGE